MQPLSAGSARSRVVGCRYAGISGLAQAPSTCFQWTTKGGRARSTHGCLILCDSWAQSLLAENCPRGTCMLNGEDALPISAKPGRRSARSLGATPQDLTEGEASSEELIEGLHAGGREHRTGSQYLGLASVRSRDRHWRRYDVSLEAWPSNNPGRRSRCLRPPHQIRQARCWRVISCDVDRFDSSDHVPPPLSCTGL